MNQRRTSTIASRSRQRLIASGMLSALVVCLAVLACEIPGEATASSSGPTVLNTCSYAALNAAVQKGGVIRFACNGTIPFTAWITVTKAVTIDATGHSVTFDGQSKWQIFRVKGGSLTLVNLTLANAFVVGEDGYPATAVTPWDLNGTTGAPGAAGTDGADGDASDHNGANGGPGGKGGDGGAGGNADNGGSGGAGQGGAIVVAPGAQLVVIGGTFKNDDAKGGLGGNGGVGGKGGDGGLGGNGGRGGSGAYLSDQPAGNGGNAGNGGKGGLGGNGGNGSDGGLGAMGAGGAIYSQGTVIIVGAAFDGDTARGGDGGDAGGGGAGGVGGSGGTTNNPGNGGVAFEPPEQYWDGLPGYNGSGGSAADGGSAGASGKAGQGGAGLGGAIYSAGILRVFGATFTSTVAEGGSGGEGGSAGDPGVGGYGQEGGVGGKGGDGENGVSGTNGGNGGDGSGGAIYTEQGNTAVIESCTFSATSAKGDEGGSGGDGSSGGAGGLAGLTDDGFGPDAAVGGNGGNGGSGGSGGMGGSGIGGAVHVGSPVSESLLTFKSCVVTLGSGGVPGAAGEGGAGGKGGGVDGSDVVGADGAPGSDGAAGFPGVKGSAVQPQIDGGIQALAALAVSKRSADLRVGRKCTITLSAKGGKAPYRWQALSLPPELVLNTRTGRLSGKPTTAGTFALAVLVTDSAGGTHRMGAARFTIEVAKK